MFDVSNYAVLDGANGHPSGYVPIVFNFRVQRVPKQAGEPCMSCGQRKEGPRVWHELEFWPQNEH